MALPLASRTRSHIQKLQNLINKNKEDYSIIAPSFQWAQGKTDVRFSRCSHA